jgi:predicted nucleotide-binding protein (sugar kinase/HSP70/actin superfamily)
MGNLKIGIPQALLYYEYFPLWKNFLECLGVEVIISGPTTKEIIDLGVKSAISEICFPVKVFYGHVMSLKDRVDYLFIPRMVCVEKGAYFCPKFLGLPDMIKSSLSSLPPLIEPTIDIRKSATNFKNSFLAVGKLFTNNSKKIYQSFYEAQRSLQLYLQSKENELDQKIINQQYNKKLTQRDLKNSINIALLGHSYLIYDYFINLNLISKLKKVKVNVLTAEMVKKRDIKRQLKKLYKPIFWTLSKKSVGSAFYFLEKKVDGIIHLTSFECGEDSLIGEIIHQESQKYPSVAYTEFVFDEHTGEIGIDTRTEAFLDMIVRRKRYESNYA